MNLFFLSFVAAAFSIIVGFFISQLVIFLYRKFVLINKQTFWLLVAMFFFGMATSFVIDGILKHV